MMTRRVGAGHSAHGLSADCINLRTTLQSKLTPHCSNTGVILLIRTLQWSRCHVSMRASMGLAGVDAERRLVHSAPG